MKTASQGGSRMDLESLGWLRLPHLQFGSFCPETSYFAGAPELDFRSVQVLDLNTSPAGYVFPPTRTPDDSVRTIRGLKKLYACASPTVWERSRVK